MDGVCETDFISLKTSSSVQKASRLCALRSAGHGRASMFVSCVLLLGHRTASSSPTLVSAAAPVRGAPVASVCGAHAVTRASASCKPRRCAFPSVPLSASVRGVGVGPVPPRLGHRPLLSASGPSALWTGGPPASSARAAPVLTLVQGPGVACVPHVSWARWQRRF